MSWSRFVRRLRSFEGLLADLGFVFNMPLLRIRREWRACRRARREMDRRLAAWRQLPEDEALKWIHPASPNKPEGWSLEEYKENQRRQRGPAH